VIVAIPADTPVTIPVVEPTVAIELLLLLHVPPEDVSLSVVFEPLHIKLIPVIGPTTANEEKQINSNASVKYNFLIGVIKAIKVQVIFYCSTTNRNTLSTCAECSDTWYMPLAGILLSDIVALRLPLVVVVLFLYTVLPSMSVISIDTSSSEPKLSAPCISNVPLFGLGAMDIPSLVLRAGTLTLKRVMVTELDNEELPQRPSAVTSQVITSPL